MRTLIVRYTPRTGSNTAKLLEAVRPAIHGDVEETDLARDLPELFNPQRVDAYGRRNYGGQSLTAEETAAMAQMDRFAAQVQRADIVILAYPMYNFGLPAAIKAWFDAVMQKGKTWDVMDGRPQGLGADKKALVLTTSGGEYRAEYPASWDTATPQARIAFTFMGFGEIAFAAAQGMSQAGTEAGRITTAAEQAQELLARWNPAQPQLARAAYRPGTKIT